MLILGTQSGSGAAQDSWRGPRWPTAPRAFADFLADPFTRGRLASLFVLVCVASWAAPIVEAAPTFEDDVLPVFREKCCGCHNADKQAGGLDLTSYGRVMAGGSSGEVIAAGDPDGSYLWQLASHASEPRMPPQADRIPDAMLDIIKTWISGGAVERKGAAPAVKKASISLALDPNAVTATDGPPVVPPRLPLEVVSHAARPLAITALAASPNGAVAAVGSRGQVLVYDTASLGDAASRGLLGVFPFESGDVKTLRFSRNAKLLVAGGGVGAKSGRVILWDVATAEQVAALGDEFDEVLAADISADHRVVALGGPQKVVRLIRTADATVESEIRKHTDWITAIEFSPNGRMLATGDRSGNAFLWETRGAREDAVLKGHGGGITAVAWRGDGDVLATASEDGKIRLWNRRTGEKMKEWEAHPGGVQGLAWLSDGRLSSCGRDRKAVLWKGDGAKERDFPMLGEIGLRVAVTSDRQRLLVGDLAGKLTAFAVETGEVIATPDTNPPKLEERLRAANAALTEIATLEKGASDKATSMAGSMHLAQSQVAEAEKVLAEAQKALAEAQNAMGEAKKSLEAATADLESVKAKQAEAARQVDRWNEEIEFSKRSRR